MLQYSHPILFSWVGTSLQNEQIYTCAALVSNSDRCRPTTAASLENALYSMFVLFPCQVSAFKRLHFWNRVIELREKKAILFSGIRAALDHPPPLFGKHAIVFVNLQ